MNLERMIEEAVAQAPVGELVRVCRDCAAGLADDPADQPFERAGRCFRCRRKIAAEDSFALPSEAL